MAFRGLPWPKSTLLRGDRPPVQPRPITLHVIRPEYPLPLGPEYLFGELAAAELIGRGYAAARQYLDLMHEGGVPFQPETMIMRTAEGSGVSSSEVMKGSIAHSDKSRAE